MRNEEEFRRIVDATIENTRRVFNKPPRDPARIGPMLRALEAAWTKHPDLRLGQLINNMFTFESAYNMEDDDMLRALERFVEEHDNGGTTG